MQAASQAYFGIDVGKVNVSQSAFLAGIINAPSLADPRNGDEQKARAERRWGVVLDAMVTEAGWTRPSGPSRSSRRSSPGPRPFPPRARTGT